MQKIARPAAAAPRARHRRADAPATLIAPLAAEGSAWSDHCAEVPRSRPDKPETRSSRRPSRCLPCRHYPIVLGPLLPSHVLVAALMGCLFHPTKRILTYCSSISAAWRRRAPDRLDVMHPAPIPIRAEPAATRCGKMVE